MAEPVKIRRIGNSLGVTLSEQVREMGLREGDSLFVVKTRDGIELKPYDPDFAGALEEGRDLLRRFTNAMKKLARVRFGGGLRRRRGRPCTVHRRRRGSKGFG